MNVIAKIAIVIFILYSCQSSQTSGKKFFEYDEIDHYSTDADDEKLRRLTPYPFKSEIDSFAAGVIVNDMPKDISDLYFIDKLESLGFKKKSVAKSKFIAIDSLFREKTVKQAIFLSCVHLYRDILIFKKQTQVIGTAKICFSCNANQIRGTNANTENFGQEGDYRKLEKILKK